MKVYGKRALLNGPGFQSTAAIVAEIEDTTGWADGKDGVGRALTGRWSAQPTANLRISDCTRTIELEIDMETDADWRNSIRKIDTMIDALSRMRVGVVEERARYHQRCKGLSD